MSLFPAYMQTGEIVLKISAWYLDLIKIYVVLWIKNMPFLGVSNVTTDNMHCSWILMSYLKTLTFSDTFWCEGNVFRRLYTWYTLDVHFYIIHIICYRKFSIHSRTDIYTWSDGHIVGNKTSPWYICIRYKLHKHLIASGE